ncbi:hypothetical protein ACS0TY_015359 [Phlomoides rotata]
MGNSKKPHAIMIPIPHQGHINPFISLALTLASKGFAVTFVHFEFVHHILSKSKSSNTTNGVELFSKERKSGLDIRCMTVGDGLPLEFDRDVHLLEFHESMLRELPAQVDGLVGKIIGSDPYSAHFLVTDTFYSWPPTVASKYNLVNVSFWTEPALVFSLLYHSELLREKGHYPLRDGVEEEVNYVPGIQSVNTKDFMPYLKEADVSTPIVFGTFKEVRKADFILHNAVDELEAETILALNKHQPNYGIGPINFSKIIPTKSSLWFESNCTHWLDSKTPGSVLYVSFGSLVHTSKQVIEEIAHGLLLSEVNFIWVIRAGVPGINGHVLPDGFEDEIKGRGLVIPWCDQVMVLSDPAVGGFLTHCGWNSVLESIWCGVPMICYPINYDQPINRKLVVDDWKIGVTLCDGICVDRKEVGDKIKQLMSGCFEQDMERVRGKLRNAVGIDGSLERNIDQFVKDLKAKIL